MGINIKLKKMAPETKPNSKPEKVEPKAVNDKFLEQTDDKKNGELVVRNTSHGCSK